MFSEVGFGFFAMIALFLFCPRPSGLFSLAEPFGFHDGLGHWGL